MSEANLAPPLQSPRLQDQFAAAIGALRAPPRGKPGPPFAALRKIVADRAAANWTMTLLEDGFRINHPQSKLEISIDLAERLAANLIKRIDTSGDREIVAIVEAIKPSGNKINDIALRLFLCLFLAHEWIHQEQRLGSFQYRDSDSYPESVLSVDYQADIASIEYLTAVTQPASLGLTDQQLLILLIYLHICTMQFFSPSAKSGTLDLPALRRLLVWHFQLARVVATKTKIDLRHPSFINEPIIEFPKLLGALSQGVTLEALTQRLNDLGGARQDIVVTIRDAEAVARIIRVSSTDNDRTQLLLTAILNEDQEKAREQIQELFDERAELLELHKLGPSDRLRSSLHSVLELSNAVLDESGDARLLSLTDGPVVELLNRLEILVLQDLPGEGWDEFKELFSAGAVQGMEGKLRTELGDRWRTSGKRGSVSSFLKREIGRIRVRLSWAAEGMG
jgi:hypothetical protein